MTRFGQVFGEGKPVIAMVHFGALPGTPLHDESRGVEGILADARADLAALQAAGFDAVMFGNENDRPYELNVNVASMRYGRLIGAGDVVKLYNISAEFAHSLDGRSLPDRARSAVMSSIPDAVLVSGTITGEAAAMSDLEAVKRVLPTTPVLANTGVKHDTVADVLAVADGVIVGSALKVGGDTWNPVDPERALDFMDRVRAARGGA